MFQPTQAHPAPGVGGIYMIRRSLRGSIATLGICATIQIGVVFAWQAACTILEGKCVQSLL
jgi:hypothetical protein